MSYIFGSNLIKQYKRDKGKMRCNEAKVHVHHVNVTIPRKTIYMCTYTQPFHMYTLNKMLIGYTLEHVQT